MAKGESGRIVLEVNPELKRQLYSVLALEQKTLKDWFVKQAGEYVTAKKDFLLSGLEVSKHEV